MAHPVAKVEETMIQYFIYQSGVIFVELVSFPVDLDLRPRYRSLMYLNPRGSLLIRLGARVDTRPKYQSNSDLPDTLDEISQALHELLLGKTISISSEGYGRVQVNLFESFKSFEISDAFRYPMSDHKGLSLLIGGDFILDNGKSPTTMETSGAVLRDEVTGAVRETRMIHYAGVDGIKSQIINHLTEIKSIYFKDNEL